MRIILEARESPIKIHIPSIYEICKRKYVARMPTSENIKMNKDGHFE